MAWCWSGSGRICRAEHSVSCSAAVRRPSSTSSAQCRQAQYWVRCCSLSTRRTSARRISTRVCRRIVVAPTRRQLLYGWNRASQMSAVGCVPTMHLKLNADTTELLWVGSRVTQSFPARRQVRCNLQVTLCDPYLSALSVRYYKKCAI